MCRIGDHVGLELRRQQRQLVDQRDHRVHLARVGGLGEALERRLEPGQGGLEPPDQVIGARHRRVRASHHLVGRGPGLLDPGDQVARVRDQLLGRGQEAGDPVDELDEVPGAGNRREAHPATLAAIALSTTAGRQTG